MNIYEKVNGSMQKVLDFLIEQSEMDEGFSAKVEKNKSTTNELFDYIKTQAKKEAVNGTACIEEEVVYGWAMHFIDENLTFENKFRTNEKSKHVQQPISTAVVKEEKEPKQKPNKISDLFGDDSLFIL